MHPTGSRNETLREGRGADRASAPARSSRRGRGLLPLLGVVILCALALVLARSSGSSDRVVDGESAPAVVAAGGPFAPAAGTPASQRAPIGSARPRGPASAPESAPQRGHAAPRGPRTEAEHLAVLRAMARSDPDGFGRRVEAIVAGDGAACEQFAAVRAAYEESWPGAAELCVRAVSVLPRESGPQAESVPHALVHWLGQRAAREPRARAVLTDIVWSGSTRVEPDFRIQALRALVLSSPEVGVRLLAARIHAEGDPAVHCAGKAALDERARPAPTFDSSQEFP